MGLYKSGGGGALSKTVLWTNPNKGNSFAAQTVTLSDNIQNYKYIAVEVAVSTTSTVSGTIIMSVEDFINAGSSYSNTAYPVLSLYTSPSSYRYSRSVTYSTDTKVVFTDAWRVNYQQTSNTNSIPWTIYGLK